jgi:tryptophan synthase alpha chain
MAGMDVTRGHPDTDRYASGVNRIDQIFRDLRSASRKALMPYLTAGDPSLATTTALLPAMQEAGASIVEVGIPFSDPIADGPVIQAAMNHALSHGLKVGKVLEAVASQRKSVSLGLVAMVSYSIVYKLGLERFVKDTAQAGFDGLIFPDLSPEEAESASDTVRSHGVVLSMLVAPTTPIDRAERIAKACSGFVYVVSRAGITGVSSALPPELPERLKRLRGVTDVPLAVGFGISNAEQVRQVVSVADAAIVGSALVSKMAAYRDNAGEGVVQDAVREASVFTRELAGGLP